MTTLGALELYLVPVIGQRQGSARRSLNLVCALSLPGVTDLTRRDRIIAKLGAFTVREMDATATALVRVCLAQVRRFLLLSGMKLRRHDIHPLRSGLLAQSLHGIRAQQSLGWRLHILGRIGDVAREPRQVLCRRLLGCETRRPT